MDLITILTSTLLAAIAPGGYIVDTAVENQLRKSVISADTLEVRVDNTPSYQLLQGKIDKIRIAGRGLQITPEFRIAALEVESDRLEFDFNALRDSANTGRLQGFRGPVQGVIHLELGETDINQFLQTPAVKQAIATVAAGILRNVAGEGPGEGLEITQTTVDFRDRQRLRVTTEIRPRGGPDPAIPPITVALEFGLELVAGDQLRLVAPQGWFNGEPLPPFLLEGFAVGLGRNLTLNSLESSGLTARLLRFEIDEDHLTINAFVRLTPD